MDVSYKISKITKNGRDVHRVYLGLDPVSKKKRYKQFRTKLEAGVWVRNEKIRQLEHGRITSGLDGALVSTWNRLDQELGLLGTNLAEVGADALKRLAAATKRGTAAECLAEFLLAKTSELKRPRYIGDLRKKANAFLRTLPNGESTEMRMITRAEIVEYLNSLKSSQVDRENHETTIGVWMRWATANGWLGGDPMPKRQKGRKKADAIKKGEAVILTPSAASKLLRACIDSGDWMTTSFVALALFAGVRPEAEFRKRIIDPDSRKRRTVTLKWEDIKPGRIAISKELSKTGVPRMIPIQPVLKTWLDYIRNNAPSPLKGDIVRGKWSKLWTEWRRQHWPYAWHQDQLRHSFGSYRLAECKNESKVALEMGNTPYVVLKHYWRWETLESEALEFWDLTPKKIKK